MNTFRNICRHVLILSLLFTFFYPHSKVFGLVFPLPKGNVYITNGYEGSETHQGKSKFSLDLRTYQKKDPCVSYGAPVLASESGQIIFLQEEKKRKGKGYGNHIILKTSDGRRMWYGHMIRGSLFAKGPTAENKNIVGDIIKQGQILGLLGDTGRTEGMICNAFDGTNSGAHLHFEMRDQAVPGNPQNKEHQGFLQ
jgi:murein DD-endopeptidase MepM/ murein hydrolase activator NlpD